MWEEHDQRMRKLKQIYQRQSKRTQLRLQEIFNSFQIDFEHFYDIARNKEKQRINEYIDQWQEDGLLKGQFGLLARNIRNRKNVKNSEILELLIYSAYAEEQNRLDDIELANFKEEANYYYQEGEREVNDTLKKKKLISIIPDSIMLALITLPLIKGYTWDEYKQAMAKYNADQIYRQASICLQQKKLLKIDSDVFQNIIIKEQNQRLNINDDKISGDVDLLMVGLANKAKGEGMCRLDPKAKVRFIAVEDNVTTKMCRSLNGQIFNVHYWNKFRRYSEINGHEMEYRCYGLTIGLNCPPIDDHFHWCRSTIQYLSILANNKEMEYNIENFLRIESHDKTKHKNYDLDYEMAAIEYQQLPENVRNMLEKNGVKFKFDYNRKTSGYDKDKKEILLVPDLVEGETTHEIGHAIFDLMEVEKMPDYRKIVLDIFNQASGPRIKADRVKEYFYLETLYNVENEYQVFLGYKDTPDKVSYNILNDKLPELFSEAYRVKYFGGKQSQELNQLVEEVEKQC